MTYEFKGIQNNPQHNNVIIYVDIERNDTTYNWALLAPLNVNFSEFLDSNIEALYQEIDMKEAQWSDTDPDIKDDEGLIIGRLYKEEIVCPDLNIPQSISARQARLVLLSMDKLTEVETFIENLPEPNKSIAKTEWEYATTLDRYHPLVLTLAELMGLTKIQIDILFKQAAQL